MKRDERYPFEGVEDLVSCSDSSLRHLWRRPLGVRACVMTDESQATLQAPRFLCFDESHLSIMEPINFVSKVLIHLGGQQSRVESNVVFLFPRSPEQDVLPISHMPMLSCGRNVERVWTVEVDCGGRSIR